MDEFEKKTEKLSPEAKTYIGTVISQLQKLKNEKDLKSVAKELIQNWNDLDEKAKDSVKEQFPSIPKVLGSTQFQKIAEEKAEDTKL